MWWKLLLSLALSGSFSTTRAQLAGRCLDPQAADSAITHIQHTYAYTTDAWQLACDSLLAICPGLDQVWQMKAMPNIKMGNWPGAFAPLAHAVALNPEQWLPYQAFLKCIFAKDYEGALTDFEACERLIRGAGVMDHSFDFYRGLSYLCLDSLAQAAVYLQKDIAEQERRRGSGNAHHVSLCYRGICLLQQGQYLAAARTFRKCLAIYPQYPEPNFYLGRTYVLTGKPVLARACFVRAGQYIREGYNSSEDQEPYVNYPFAIGAGDVREALERLKEP